MKFSSILFSSEMINAILENRKSQTRRVVKGEALKLLEPEMFTPEYVASPENNLCPYGKVGDILWVRETWKKSNPYGKPHFQYKAEWDSYNTGVNLSRWKPSIHMPKEACRLFLKIKCIKIERIHDITQEDAISEGIKGNKKDGFRVYGKYGGMSCAQVSFESLWQSINGHKSWKLNPWVWVIEFERIDKPETFNH